MKLVNKIQKRYILSFLIGAILFGGISVVLATGLASSGIDYTTTANNNVETVGDALDDLYPVIMSGKYYDDNNYLNPKYINGDGVGGEISFVYWNTWFDDTGCEYNQIPSSHTYASRELLAQNYSSFSNWPIYIKTTKVGNTVVGHAVCGWYNNKEFCMKPNYWIDNDYNGSQTLAKFEKDMKLALDTDVYTNLDTDIVDVGVEPWGCAARNDGFVICQAGTSLIVECGIYSDGLAYCGGDGM